MGATLAADSGRGVANAGNPLKNPGQWQKTKGKAAVTLPPGKVDFPTGLPVISCFYGILFLIERSAGRTGTYSRAETLRKFTARGTAVSACLRANPSTEALTCTKFWTT
jgi:hypothetical protein